MKQTKLFDLVKKWFKKGNEVKPIKRVFKVGHTLDNTSKEITSYFVTDAHDNKELDIRPHLMTFPVSLLYPAEDQNQRAEEYAEYMNRIVEATQQAYENNNLMDILKGKGNGS